VECQPIWEQRLEHRPEVRLILDQLGAEVGHAGAGARLDVADGLGDLLGRLLGCFEPRFQVTEPCVALL
jgi:hypothetical protein